jgi:hypothetical protein
MQRLALAKMREKEKAGEIPTSIRFIFYELEQAGLVSKRVIKLDGTEGRRKPTQDLTDALTLLRELGLVPWEWIVDESRDVHAYRHSLSVRDHLLESLDTFSSLDRFPGVPRPVLLCEARGVAGVLDRAVGLDYLITTVPLGGNTTGFLHTDVVPYFREGDIHPLYIGDRDLCGNDIEEHTRRVLEHATGRTFERWERLMLTDVQCRDLKRRRVKPIKKTDNRFKDGRPHDAYEVEALGQKMVTEIVRARLEELAPVPLAEVLDQEEEQCEEMRRLLQPPPPAKSKRSKR